MVRKTQKPGKSARSGPVGQKRKPSVAGGDPDVAAFLDALDHPQKHAIEAVRELILGVDSAIQEGIKWSAPSFRTDDWFATVNLRGKGGDERVWLILHTGAKKSKAMKVADPMGLLKWLAKDRCLVMFEDETDVKSKGAALKAIVRGWVRAL